MTSQLTLDLGLVCAGEHRIVTTREPVPRPAPSFMLVRNATSRAWAVGVNVEPDVAEVLDALANDESPAADPTLPPRHEARYRELLGDKVTFGPKFRFPEVLDEPAHAIEVIHDEEPLSHHFRGWVRGEIAAGCAPVMAIVIDGKPVSVCFSARSSPIAAAAGVETAVQFVAAAMPVRSLPLGPARSAQVDALHFTARRGRTPPPSPTRASWD